MDTYASRLTSSPNPPSLTAVFSFAGQVIFIELQSDMARPQDFPKAVAASLSVMAPVYGVIGAVGFAAIGKAALANGKPITSHSTTDVPFVAMLPADSTLKFDRAEGAVADCAPTMLKFMEIDVPKEMTGKPFF